MDWKVDQKADRIVDRGGLRRSRTGFEEHDDLEEGLSIRGTAYDLLLTTRWIGIAR